MKYVLWAARSPGESPPGWYVAFKHYDPHFLIARTYAVDGEVEWHYPTSAASSWYGETSQGIAYRISRERK
jgi:hypothetical protein